MFHNKCLLLSISHLFLNLEQWVIRAALSSCNTKQEVAITVHCSAEQRTRTVDEYVLIIFSFMTIAVAMKEGVEKNMTLIICSQSGCSCLVYLLAHTHARTRKCPIADAGRKQEPSPT